MNPQDNDDATRARARINPLRVLDDKREQVQAQLADAPLPPDHLCAQCADHFTAVQSMLTDLAVPFTIDKRLVRGLDYYMRTTFEFVHDGLGAQSAVGGGGRYDGLAELIGGPQVPGIGWALGVERTVLALTAEGVEPPVEQSLSVFVVPLGAAAKAYAVGLVGSLRRAGISSDLAYYLNKRERGFDLAFIMLGADHHGYVSRMMAMCAAFGDTPHENLEILIGQMVNLIQDGEPVRMSKRAGTVVVLEDLVEAVGVDAARYALTRFSTDSMIDIDLDLLTKSTNENPVFYVQYTHARTCNVTRLAGEDGVHLADGFDPSLLTHDSEAALLAILGDFPRIVAQAARMREPHRVPRYLEDLAGRYHKWYDDCRVRPREADEEVTDLHRTRLWLNEATRVVLANGLGLLGVSAPERL